MSLCPPAVRGAAWVAGSAGIAAPAVTWAMFRRPLAAPFIGSVVHFARVSLELVFSAASALRCVGVFSAAPLRQLLPLWKSYWAAFPEAVHRQGLTVS